METVLTMAKFGTSLWRYQIQPQCLTDFNVWFIPSPQKIQLWKGLFSKAVSLILILTRRRKETQSLKVLIWGEEKKAL